MLDHAEELAAVGRVGVPAQELRPQVGAFLHGAMARGGGGRVEHVGCKGGVWPRCWVMDPSVEEEEEAPVS